MAVGLELEGLWRPMGYQGWDERGVSIAVDFNAFSSDFPPPNRICESLSACRLKWLQSAIPGLFQFLFCGCRGPLPQAKGLDSTQDQSRSPGPHK